MTGHEDETAKAREDAAWQDIVDSYGERPDFPSGPPAATVPEPAAIAPPDVPAELFSPDWEDEGHYVPPPPPPLPRLSGPRGAAWVGLFGVPALMLVLLLVHVSLPSPLPFLMLVAFIGSFGYLVATMSKGDPDGGWDDGAVL